MRDACADPQRRRAWLQLALAPGLSPRAARRALLEAGGPEAALARPLGWWRALGRAGRELALEVHPAHTEPEPALRRIAELGARALTPEEADWPHAAFQGLHEPPCALFVRGTWPTEGRVAVALVGTRAATPYGLRVARELGEGLARRGVVIVSGLALGIDAAAHAGALASGAEAPRTVAVLGCGLAVPYPPENATLRDEVALAGALVSEHAPDVPPERWHFPRRNRIVAALARAVVVVEAPLRSGALITAGFAVEQGREVLAVPGPIGRFTHEGGHRLLKEQSASLCRGVDDVLLALGLAAAGESPRAVTLPAPGPQLALWRLLSEDEALDADGLCRASALPASEVAAALASLELDGRVVRVPGVGYLRR